MKRKGCSILFLNSAGQILLFLRDNKAGIPYPNMWDVPGGHVESGETPAACIVREMEEEMGLDLTDFRLFCRREFSDRMEYTYWKRADFNLKRIELTEGQKLKWFSRKEAEQTPLAYGFNSIVESFFQQITR